MDESWRMGIGLMNSAPKLQNCPPRRSTEDASSAASAAAAAALRKTISAAADDPLNPEDFTDVFGGPPRTVLSRQFTTNLPRSSTVFFYDDIFRQPYTAAQGGRRRNYQNSNEFYSDIYGWDDERVVRSRSRSKASSSSALSSEELSPLRPAISDDGYDEFSLFGAKLRPIHVKPRWNSRRMQHEHHQLFPPSFTDNHPNPIHITPKNDLMESLRNHPFGSSSRRKLSLESNLSFVVPTEDLHVNSPSSAVSSVCNSDKDAKIGNLLEQEEEDLESMNSYVIEISGSEDRCESNDVDEAIAWAKETFRRPCLGGEKPTEMEVDGNDRLLEGMKEFASQYVEEPREECAGDETRQIEAETQLLDEKIRLWSTGKESDIRLLLSSMHHILWPNSGWLPIPLMNLIENSEVKKAYQKAQLCLHPDKLQQRGATIMEKYIAKKVFSALQDAWAAFVSQDVFSR